MSDEQFKQIIQRLDALRQLLDAGDQHNELLDNSDIIRLLKISKNTAAAWRDKGMLPFTKIGKKIYYQHSEIRYLLRRRRR
ncbi:MAG: helix-turn-helix domain-containing protein [Bacteroidetes bacterium]|nr:helix-turn-helix domain-containing protein [Bacteroidota bacterium]